MSISVTKLDLELFERLPAHVRSCVFWEVDTGDTGIGFESGSVSESAFESEFDKEAWISGLLLEWGTCGQLAIESTTGAVVGTALYAPPNRVPRSQFFPTSPVSHDAVLLTSIRTQPGFEEAAPELLDAVVTDLIRRGVRAVEAFGLVHGEDPDVPAASTTASGGGGLSDPEVTGAALADVPDDITKWSDAEIIEVAREILAFPQEHICTECMIGASFLKDSAFELVAAHPRYPRFRLELDEGLGWKAEVEGALEKLVVMAAIDLAGRERTPATTG